MWPNTISGSTSPFALLCWSMLPWGISTKRQHQSNNDKAAGYICLWHLSFVGIQKQVFWESTPSLWGLLPEKECRGWKLPPDQSLFLNMTCLEANWRGKWRQGHRNCTRLSGCIHLIVMSWCATWDLGSIFCIHQGVHIMQVAPICALRGMGHKCMDLSQGACCQIMIWKVAPMFSDEGNRAIASKHLPYLKKLYVACSS